jgi:dipeptidyl aminopeptidase/acylaminoacyl peptidase
MRRLLAWLFAMLAFPGLGCGGAQRALTTADAIETADFMTASAASENIVSISPNALRYVLRVKRGDIAGNGVWIDILSGTLDALASASQPRLVARLFSTGRGDTDTAGAASDLSGKQSPILWLDDRRIVFLHSDAQELRQVALVNLVTGRVQFLTHQTSQVVSFAISPGGTVLFQALRGTRPRRGMRAPEQGFTIPNRADLFGLIGGHFDGTNLFDLSWNSEWFLQRPGEPSKPLPLGGSSFDAGYPIRRLVSMAPDGRHVVLVGPARSVPEEWDRYGANSPESTATLRANLKAARADPSGREAREISQLYLVDVLSGSARPLWNAIADYGTRAEWSADGKRLLLAPTYLPLNGSHVRGITDSAVAVCDVETGQVRELPTAGTGVTGMRWTSNRSIAIDRGESDGVRTHRFALQGAAWKPVTAAKKSFEAAKQTISFEFAQSANAPPRLFAVGGRLSASRLALDPNPNLLARFRLGRAARLSGTLGTGEKWRALLFHPVDYRRGTRYPLVVQYGGLGSGDSFTLYGPTQQSGLGPSDVAPYAAQILAGREIAALNFVVDAPGNSPREPQTWQRASEEIVESLVVEGLIDRNRVGLVGFSRAGYFVSYTVTHSAFPYAALSIADNYEPSYLQTILGDTYTDSSLLNGGEPHGAGLQAWLKAAPGFNIDKIRAPVRYIGQSYGAREYVLTQWESFALLRKLGRPVEMYLMPEIDQHPSHGPQNPAQVIAVQESTVDWFDFWLNGSEEPHPAKVEQYDRWNKLRVGRRP